MKPRPLCRSLTFWSGILVMGFICWAWWDSMRAVSMLYSNPLGAANGAGGMALFYDESPGSIPRMDRMDTKARVRKGGEADPGIWFVLSPPDPAPSFPKPMVVSGDGVDAFLPHWLNLLGVAVPWSGLLLWRARRIRRATSKG